VFTTWLPWLLWGQLVPAEPEAPSAPLAGGVPSTPSARGGDMHRMDSVGVVLRPSKATAGPVDEQRIEWVLSQSLGLSRERLVFDAVDRARLAIADVVPLVDVEIVVQAQRAVDVAWAWFREGRLTDVEASLAEIFAALRAHPGVPGVPQVARDAHLIAARSAWTRGDGAAADLALRHAIALDPDAGISTVRFPPDFVARYVDVRSQVLSERSTWSMPSIPFDPAVEVEIDGHVLVGPVPNGEHFVVLRRLGAAPTATVWDRDHAITIEPPKETISMGPPASPGAAMAVCEVLRLGRLLIVEARAEQWGVQLFDCKDGFRRPWFWSLDEVTERLSNALERPTEAGTTTDLDAPWPTPEPKLAIANRDLREIAPEPDRPKPWYRRAWIWALVGTLIVAGAVTGIVLGTRASTRHVLEIPGSWTGER